MSARRPRAATPGARLQEIGRRAAAAAHDLNNALGAILAATDEMLARDGLGAATAQDLRTVRCRAEHGAALVRALLDGSACPGAPADIVPVALDPAVAQLAPGLRALLGPRIALEIAAGLPGIRTRLDPLRLERVLANLVANARDAMPAGGVVTIRTEAVDMPPGGTVPPGRYAALSVTDQGGGIPPDLLPRVFAPFVTTKRERGGFGLGLAAVRDIVEGVGGCVTAGNAVGAGACVSVYVPQADAPPPALPPTPGRARSTVLLVDDDDAIRCLGARALRRRGWEVQAVESAEAALALLEAGEPAVLVADLALSGRDGLDLFDAARRRFPGLPLVLVSGYAGGALQARCAALGAVFLAKPFGLGALAEAVARAAGAPAVPVADPVPANGGGNDARPRRRPGTRRRAIVHAD